MLYPRTPCHSLKSASKHSLVSASSAVLLAVLTACGLTPAAAATDAATDAGALKNTLQEMGTLGVTNGLSPVALAPRVAQQPDAANEAGALVRSQVVIGGVSLDMTEADIRRQLGEPASTRQEETECCGVMSWLDYDTLSVGYTEERGVFLIRTDRSEVSTGAGVRVGDPLEAVIVTYGLPSRYDQGAIAYNIEGDSPATLSFALKDGFIWYVIYFALLD